LGCGYLEIGETYARKLREEFVDCKDLFNQLMKKFKINIRGTDFRNKEIQTVVIRNDGYIRVDYSLPELIYQGNKFNRLLFYYNNNLTEFEKRFNVYYELGKFLAYSSNEGTYISIKQNDELVKRFTNFALELIIPRELLECEMSKRCKFTNASNAITDLVRYTGIPRYVIVERLREIRGGIDYYE
jgi:Zn-dependent peptidase ImmA (M78 family)